MGKRRSKTTTKQRKAKSAEQQRKKAKHVSSSPGALIAKSFSSGGEAKKNGLEAGTSTSIQSSNPRLSSQTRNNNLNNTISVAQDKNKVKGSKRSRKLLMNKWSAFPQENDKKKFGPSSKKKQEERRDFENNMTSLREREYNKRVKGSGGPSSILHNMQPAILKCFPTTLTEHVDHTASLVEEKLDIITQTQVQNNFKSNNNNVSANSTASHVQASNPLLELAERKRKEMFVQQTTVDVKSNNAHSGKDATASNPYSVLASCEDSDDDNDNGNEYKRKFSPTVKPLQFAPPSFNFNSSSLTGNGRMLESCAVSAGPILTTGQDDNIDPDL